MSLLATGSSTAYVDISQYETFENTIKLVRGDTLPEITFTLKDAGQALPGVTLDPVDPSTWAPMDLTGASIVLKLRPLDSTVVKEVIPIYVFGGDPTQGKVFMQWTNTALDTAGVFTGEIEVTSNDGKVGTVYSQLHFIVREDY